MCFMKVGMARRRLLDLYEEVRLNLSMFSSKPTR